jgi:hypothetical protein
VTEAACIIHRSRVQQVFDAVPVGQDHATTREIHARVRGSIRAVRDALDWLTRAGFIESAGERPRVFHRMTAAALTPEQAAIVARAGARKRVHVAAIAPQVTMRVGP